MTQAELANYIGVPKSTINRAESQRLPLKPQVYAQLIQKLEAEGLSINLSKGSTTVRLSDSFIQLHGKSRENT